VRRPRPLARLIDPGTDASGAAIARRVTFLTVPAMVVANAIGAGVVLVLAAFVIPTPSVEDNDAALLANVIVTVAYVSAALAVGVWWGLRSLRPVLEWLRSERAPSEREQRMALRAPLRVVFVHAVLWGAGVVVFAALNGVFSLVLALVVAVTVALGGVTTCAFAYVLTERIGRPVVARALAEGVPARPILPGVTARTLLAWALGSGVAVVGLVLVGLAALVGAPVRKTQLEITMLGLGGVALVVGLLLALLSARSVSAPVISVRGALGRVERGDFDVEVPVYDGGELGLLQAGFNRMVAGLRERERMRDLFSRHVGEDVAQVALERGTELGGEVREVGVLFVDLVGSTEMAATRPPTEVVELLNRFFAVVVDVVAEHGGAVDKFEGDAALAVFGAPVPRPDAAACALAAGRTLAQRLRRELPDIDAGIGVSYGRVVAGNVGDERRFEYTVIGDAVNEAARLTEVAKSSPQRVVASAAAVEAAGSDEAARWKQGEQVQLRGRTQPTVLATPA
jgi:adenylate cyclase